MKIICPSCGADFQLNSEQGLNDGLQIKCPACLHVFMAYADGTTSSVEELENPIEGLPSSMTSPPPPPPPPSASSTMPPPPPPSVGPPSMPPPSVDPPSIPPPRVNPPSMPPPLLETKDDESDVFDFSFGDVETPRPPSDEPEPAPTQSADEDAFDFSFGVQSKTVEPPPKPSSTPSSPLGNLFDDLEDLPQPKFEEAELPAPKLEVDLPGVREAVVQSEIEVPSFEQVSPLESHSGLQAPDVQPVEHVPNVPTTPIPTATAAEKKASPFYLVLAGLISIGVICSVIYFGGLGEGDPSDNSVVPKPENTPTRAQIKQPTEAKKTTRILAQVSGFMEKIQLLESQVKPGDEASRTTLETFLALGCLQFPSHGYFCTAAKKALEKLEGESQAIHVLALRLANQDEDARKAILAQKIADSTDAISLLLRGYAALQIGELEQAVEFFATAYEQNSEFTQAIRISTEISIRRGDYEGAQASLSALEEMSPSIFPSLFLRARLEYEKPDGDLEVALKALAQAEMVPLTEISTVDQSSVFELKGRILRRQDQGELAIVALSKAARLNPSNERVLRLLGAMYFDRNEFDAALVQIRQLEKDGKVSPQLLVLKADCFRRMGQKQNALSIIDEAKQRFKESVALFLFEGDLLVEERNYKAAEDSYAKAIALSPNDIDIQLKLAKLLMAQSKIEEAKSLLEAKLKAKPNSSALLVGYARMRKQLGDIGGGDADYEPAKTSYLAALKQNANQPNVRLELVDVLLKLGETNFAETQLNRVVASGPAKHSVNYLRGRILSRKGKYGEAVEALSKAKSHYQQDPIFLVHMAAAAFFGKQYETAAQLLESARLIDNKQSRVYHLLGRTAFEQAQYDSAIRNLKQAIKLDGQGTASRYWLARSHLSREEEQNAARELDRIIKDTEPNQVLKDYECDTLFLRARMLRAEGLSAWARALRLLDKHLKCADQNASAYLLRGQIHADYRSLDKARKDFNQAANLASKNGSGNIAAQAFYEAAKTLKRKSRFSENELLKLYEKSVNADGSYAPPRRDLCVLLAQSKPKEAKLHCKAYLGSQPKGTYASEVREVLRNL